MDHNDPTPEQSTEARTYSLSQVTTIMDSVLDNAISQPEQSSAPSQVTPIIETVLGKAMGQSEQLSEPSVGQEIVNSLFDDTIRIAERTERNIEVLPEEIELLRSPGGAESIAAPLPDIPVSGNSETETEKWRIGTYIFTRDSEIQICGMKFIVKKRVLEERNFYLIKRPTLRYRQNGDRLSSNVIFEQGFDRSQPILIALGEDSEQYIIDGDWRYNQINRCLSDGKMKINRDATHSEVVDGIRFEHPIPALYLLGQQTTKLQRLAISMTLNTTAINQVHPLQMGDIILSLDAFIRSKYEDITDISSSELLDRVDDISKNAMSLQLLHLFIENNSSHREFIQRWTLDNTSNRISSQNQVDLMNRYEQYKLYVASTVSFVNSPDAFSYVFGEKSKQVPRTKFECQWTLRLFSDPKFAVMSDSRKTFLLLTLLARQVKWGTRSIPYTPITDVMTIIDLTEAIFSTARSCMNKRHLSKNTIEDVPIENAILPNHPDDIVKEGPYIRSILFFLTYWRAHSRKYSKSAILKEVKRDLTGWPSKRTWKAMETKQYTAEGDLMTVIEREMYSGNPSAPSTGRKRSRRTQGGSSTKRRKQVDVSDRVLAALDDEDAFGNLIDMGQKFGVSRAVQTFTQQATQPATSPQDQKNSISERIGPDQQDNAMEIDETPMVPLATALTKAVEWFGKRKIHRKKFKTKSAKQGTQQRIETESSYESSPHSTESSESNIELAFERYSNLTPEETIKVADMLKENLEPITDNLPNVFDANDMWSHYITQEDLDGITTDYKAFAVQDIKVDDPLPDPRPNESELNKLYANEIMAECYKKISAEKLQCNGYLYLRGFFNDTSSDWIDEYIEHFSSKFPVVEDEENEYWKSVLASLAVDKPGRYQMFNGEEVFSELAKNSSVLKSKMLVEVKMGMALAYVAKDFTLKMDSLGSHLIAGTEDFNGTTPIYNHEIGRHVNSSRCKNTDFTPFQLIATGKHRMVIKVYRSSHFHSHLPWTNREDHAQRFEVQQIRMDSYSLLVIRGNMLHSFTPSRDTSIWNETPWFALRWFACHKDYDERDDKDADLSSEDRGSSEEISDSDREDLEDELKGLKIDADKEPSDKAEGKDTAAGFHRNGKGAGDDVMRTNEDQKKKKKAGKITGSQTKKSRSVSSAKKQQKGKKIESDKSSSEYSSAQNSSPASDSDADEQIAPKKDKHPTTGRKGLSAIRPTMQTTRGRRYLQEKSRNAKKKPDKASACNATQKKKSSSKK